MIKSTEPDPSSDDELDTEDGDVDTPGSANITQRARDGRTDAKRDTILSAPPPFASTSASATVGENSRSQMKRKELESLFTSKKRVRYSPTTHSDQDVHLDEPSKFKRHMGINSKPALGIFLVYLSEDIFLIYLLRENNHRWIEWQAT